MPRGSRDRGTFFPFLAHVCLSAHMPPWALEEAVANAFVCCPCICSAEEFGYLLHVESQETHPFRVFCLGVVSMENVCLGGKHTAAVDSQLMVY